MRRTIFSCALLLGFAGACAVAGAGCGGDDSGVDNQDSSTPKDSGKDQNTGDTSKPDTGPGQDGSTEDAADTSTGDTSTGDTSTGDTSTGDSGDAGTDAPKDTGTDTSTVDAADAADTSTPDAADTSTGDDASDAADTSTGNDASDAADTSTGPTFDNPIQIPISNAILIHNTVLTTTPLNGFHLNPMDGTTNNNTYATDAKDKQLSATAKGLPNDGTFPAVVGVHPLMVLHWNDSVNQDNSRIVNPGDPAFTFDVPQNVYNNIMVAATSANGDTTIAVTITYTDTTTSGGTFTVKDWFNSSGSPTEVTLINGLNRITGGNTIDNRSSFELTGTNINPTAGKTVKQVTINNTGTGIYVFYGATGY